MTREEQIIEAAEKATYQKPPQYSELTLKTHKVMCAYEVGFIDGCVWADETMIKRTINWVNNNIKKYVFEGRGGKPYVSVALIDDLRNAMKGGES